MLLPRTAGRRILFGIACAGWLALATAFVAELVTPRWEGCNELPSSPGQTITIIGWLTGLIVLAVAASLRIAVGFTRREVAVFCLVVAVSIAALAGVLTLGWHHATTGGCG